MNFGNPSPYSEQKRPALIADAVVKKYTKSCRPALDHFTLQVAQGEFFGLLGTNGAGKSTAVSIFSGFFAPDRGTVSVMGLDFQRHRTKIRQLLGLVPQDIALYDQLSARENLWFFGRLHGFSGKKLQARIDQCLEFSGLTEQGKRLVSTYSGGMKRRLNLAGGLLHGPQILFLDEPTVGIDTQSRHLIHQQLKELHRSGTTILYTTHYMEEAQELCSRIGIIDAGKIIVQGSPGDLVQQSCNRNLEALFLELTGKQLRDN